MDGGAGSDDGSSGIPPGFEPLDFAILQTFVAHIGPFYIKTEPGGPCLGLRAQPQHCNPFGELHGGFIAAMADLACSLTLIRGPKPTATALTLQLSTQMIASARVGDWVEARGELRRKGRSIAFLGCSFTSGDRLIAQADAVFRVLSEAGVNERFSRLVPR